MVGKLASGQACQRWAGDTCRATGSPAVGGQQLAGAQRGARSQRHKRTSAALERHWPLGATLACQSQSGGQLGGPKWCWHSDGQCAFLSLWLLAEAPPPRNRFSLARWWRQTSAK